MTPTRSVFFRPTLASDTILCLAATLNCSTQDEPGGDGDGDGNGGAVTPIDQDGDGVPDGVDTDGDGVIDVNGVAIDEDGDGTFDGIDTDGDGVIDVRFPPPGGDGDVTGTGGVPGGDGDAPATGGDVGVGGNGDGNGGGGNTPPGFENCAVTSTIQELGGAYSTEDNNGPDDHSAMYGANPRIVAATRGDGTFDVTWQSNVGDNMLYVTHIGHNAGTYSAEWSLQVPSLGVIGGLAIDSSGDPVVVTAVDERIAGDTEPAETHRPDIMAIVRIGNNCMEKYRQDLRTDFDGDGDRLPLYSPFTAGTSRLAVGGGTYVVHYSQNTEYDPGVSSRHQIGRYIIGSSETGAISSVPGNISHSFDQRLHFDGTGFVSLSLGDASLRGIALSYIKIDGDKDQRTILAIKGGDGNTGGGYNNTFTRLGDVRHAKSGFVSIFATEEAPTHPERVSSTSISRRSTSSRSRTPQQATPSRRIGTSTSSIFGAMRRLEPTSRSPGSQTTTIEKPNTPNGPSLYAGAKTAFSSSGKCGLSTPSSPLTPRSLMNGETLSNPLRHLATLGCRAATMPS